MLSRNPVLSGPRTGLQLCLAGLNVLVEAPEGVLSVLDAMLRFVPRSAHASADLRIVAQTREDIWEIRGDSGSLKVLGAQSSLPQIAGADEVAKRIGPRQAQENLSVLEQTQRLLHSNVQEALALEVGLLKLQL